MGYLLIRASVVRPCSDPNRQNSLGTLKTPSFFYRIAHLASLFRFPVLIHSQIPFYSVPSHLTGQWQVRVVTQVTNRRVGFSVEEMIDMPNAGMSIRGLLERIACRLTATEATRPGVCIYRVPGLKRFLESLRWGGACSIRQIAT